MADVEIRVLGPLEVRVDGRVVPIGSRKQRALLAALAVEDNRPVSTDALAELLWGDEGGPPSVRVTLRSLVSRLRRALGPAGGCLAARGGGYVLKVDRAAVDAVRFERALAWGRDRLAAGHATDAVDALRDALALWRGPAHAELDGHEFARPSAHRLEEARLTAVEDLVDAELRAGLTADALARAEGQVAAQPLRERAWGQVMLARYRSGRQADALAAYRTVHALLRDELGVAPTPALVELEARILRQDPLLSDDGPTPPAARRPGPDLPTAPTPLVGRSAELVELAAELVGTRLLTLTGTGGVGKTRLAMRLATDATSAHDGGVRLVELAPLDPDAGDAAVLTEVASAVGVATAGAGTPAEIVRRIADHVGDRRVLLVVDNCEHVVDAVAHGLDALRRRCPHLTVLATSREPLGVGGEVCRAVAPLSVPPPDAAEVADLAGSDAVALFRERARAVCADFELDADNAAAVARICRRLDGIPLALELAAARMRVLGADQIAARLDDRFALLTAGERTASPRQRTLRAAVEWSHRLLTADEQVVLRRLAVFATSFDLDAAEAVAGDGDLAGRVTELVLRLVDRSVVATRRRRGTVRFVLLETVRGFAAERLADAGETAEVRARHRAHYVGLAREQRRVWGAGWDSALWHRRVAAEEENFRAAVSSALADDDHDGALLLLSGLWVHWAWAAGRAEAIGWLRRAVDGPGTDLVARSECALGLAVLLRWWEAGEPEESVRLFARAAALADEADDDACRFWARYFLAEFRMLRGDRDGARAGYLDAQRVAVPRNSAGWCSYSFGWIAMGSGEAAAARVAFARSVDLSGPDDLVRPHALAALAPLLAGSDPERAAAAAAGALASARAFPLPAVHVMALVRAAQTFVLCGEDGAAREVVAELFDLQHRLGNLQFRAESFEVVAALAARSGDHRAAARLLGAGGAVRATRTEDDAGVRVLADVVADTRRRVLAALGAEAYGRAAAAGAAVPVADLVAEVRAAHPWR
ncbi:MAG: BTAD domain-containing putative transcriptional regulator [Pseudonocardiales bacterium]|nr:BTAD domain-containing putative transcriptional regulator [Pseudonocardiales bacterium]